MRRGVKRLLAVLSLTILICLGVLHIVRTEEAAQWKDAIIYSAENRASKKDHPFYEGCVNTSEYLNDKSYERQNATFVMLTRNEELNGVVQTMRSVERRFNQWFQYPYVFMNNEPFTEEFKQRVQSLTTANVTFALIEQKSWNFPKEQKPMFKHYVESQGDRGIMYGNMVSYHRMCRFYSGIFSKHPAVQQFEWYWRIEPDVEFFCDLTYDPFFEMKKSGKKYGFTIMIKELYWTVPNLFRATRSFIRKNDIKVGSLWKSFIRNRNTLKGDDYLNSFVNDLEDLNTEMTREFLIDHLKKKWAKNKVIDKELIQEVVHRATRKVPVIEDKFDEEEYNLCHFWSNFEIARVDVFDNEVYNKYFEYLESYGGFWQERWGDAPVHSLGLALTLDAEEVHYFRDIGYQHSTIVHCPNNKANKQLPYEGSAKYAEIFEREASMMSMKDKTLQYFKSKDIDETWDTGSGCRCQCPDIRDVEDTSPQCLLQFFDLVSDSPTTEEFELPFDAVDLKFQLSNDYKNHVAQS
ncbi:unnamed protein product [Kluyveromyces dobzhanskii CBS 2104]|uniref:WGS project CCBQ000000000 data, contig 00017 n=1 Tax=Kluyveromyces dobzhanskii CBS 2104 TaxID=1427455 RepID=A0A0A8L6Q2_9SACH|nr:unnamed protein product [Kluyveromyces dobzhanskii CBS 2104]